jgi:hypothetical protein
MARKPPSKKVRKLTSRTIPPFDNLSFSYDTAASLQHLMMAQHEHAIEWNEKGFPGLLESWQNLEPFFIALSTYINKYDR